HPRGYRGTRERPPKPGLPRPYDLRRWMVSPEGVNLLLRRPGHHWPRARSILEKEGYDPGRLGRIGFDPQGVLDPYWDYHHGGDGRTRPEMPVLFSTHFLPLLRSKSPGFLRQTLAAFLHLDLRNDPDLLAHVLALLVLAEGEEEFLHASRLLLARTPARRAALAPILARSPASLSGSARVTEEDLRRIESVSPEPVYAHRVAYFLYEMCRGVAKEYLL